MGKNKCLFCVVAVGGRWFVSLLKEVGESHLCFPPAVFIPSLSPPDLAPVCKDWRSSGQTPRLPGAAACGALSSSEAFNRERWQSRGVFLGWLEPTALL